MRSRFESVTVGERNCATGSLPICIAGAFLANCCFCAEVLNRMHDMPDTVTRDCVGRGCETGV